MIKLSIGRDGVRPTPKCEDNSLLELEKIGRLAYVADEPERVHHERTYIEEHNAQKLNKK